MLAVTAILLGASLMTYVGYVIYNMFIMSLMMFGTTKKQLQNSKSLQEKTGVDTSDIDRALSVLKTNIKIWTVV